jgi:hypothetical protein
MPKLKVGDTVNWSGAWGSQFPMPAIVTDIQETDMPRSKYGREVESMDWDRMDYCVVTLDNGHWAYGTQLTPFGGHKGRGMLS